MAHKLLVIFEASGLQSDFLSYVVRSLLSEGRLIYLTVEKTQDGMRPRRIEREGPTGLIVTTTAVALHPENETRLLTLNLDDSPEQTARILEATAQDEDSPAIDLAPWLALQEWLQTAVHDVDIPYASLLAKKVPPIAIRLRRDFNVILSLIKAHAILHQATREQDAKGRIVATLDDYAVVRELVADLLAEGVNATVSKSVKETVEAVRELTKDKLEVSGVEVARYLKLDESTTSRRVRVAIGKGYLRNLEDKKGRPSRLQVAEALPTDMQLLPDVDLLSSCTVAEENEGIDDPPYIRKLRSLGRA